MEFGAVPANLLDQIDFSLPQEPVFNKAVLTGQPAANPRVYLGCTRWGYADWVGKIYPLGTKDNQFLPHYVQQFNSIEFNATHYKIYNETAFEHWAQKAGDRHFKFCPKLFQGITHRGSLTDKTDLLDLFVKGIAALGQHLGPVFIQLSESFGPNRQQELLTFLQQLPQGARYLLELRHPGWFNQPTIFHGLFDALRAHGIGAVITDTAGRRDVAHLHLPTATSMVRFVGNSLHPSDYTRADAWVQRIHYWLQNGLEELYFFLHMQDEAAVPEMAIYMSDQLNKVCGLAIPRPMMVTRQGELF